MRYELPVINTAIYDLVDRMERASLALHALGPVVRASKKRAEEGYAWTQDEGELIHAHDTLTKTYEELARLNSDMVADFMGRFDKWRKDTFNEANDFAFSGMPQAAPPLPRGNSIDQDLEASLGEALKVEA